MHNIDSDSIMHEEIMLKKLKLLMAVLLFSTLANGEVVPREIALYCIKRNTPLKCFFDQSGYCFWSYGYDYCAVRYNFPEFCRDMPNYASCVISVGCRWNREFLWCEDLDGPGFIKQDNKKASSRSICAY
jgi:hypothetical protein